MHEQNQHYLFESAILKTTNLILETKDMLKEVESIRLEIEAAYSGGKISALTFHLNSEKLERQYDSINSCLRSLANEKKLAIAKIQEL